MLSQTMRSSLRLARMNPLVMNQCFAFSKLLDASNPRVFMDVTRDSKPIGRMVFELYANEAPKTAENFRSICAGDNKMGYTYANSHFHRIIEGFMA